MESFLACTGKVANLKNPELYVTHFKELKAHLATRPAVFEYIETSMVPSSALAVDNQINHVHESICRDTMKTLVNVPNLVVPLLGKISTFAIKECLCQFKRLVDLDPTEPCSHTVTIGLGIPCAHHIMELMEDDKFVAPKDFHYQWHFRYNPEFAPSTVADLPAQMKGIAAGTHKAVMIQAHQVKKNTKEGPPPKQNV
ncbi:hypothetical protein H4Q26_012756 [Puccinia striiformis f. sp. tritici PST-130]|nr:hypothetical protein H4Q26_012756 [Puccinia striiformis f. sp. tritici PST-130]